MLRYEATAVMQVYACHTRTSGSTQNVQPLTATAEQEHIIKLILLKRHKLCLKLQSTASFEHPQTSLQAREHPSHECPCKEVLTRTGG